MLSKLKSLTFITLLILVSSLTGCRSHISDAHMDNHVAMANAEQTWFQHIIAEDYDAAMEFISEDFTSEAYPTKSALAEYFSSIKGKNILTEQMLTLGLVHYSGDQVVASAGPYHLKLTEDFIVTRIQFKNEETGWRIVGMTK